MKIILMTSFSKFIFLAIISISTLSSCGQTQSSQKKSKSKTPVKNYFDSNDQILFKLYKKTESGFLYWETWNTDDKNAIVHWGVLGTYGEDRPVSTPDLVNLKDSLNSLITEKIKEGYSEIPIDKQYTLAITFKLKTWGTPEDLDRREKYRNFITDNLGWTGNGRCDDGDIGSGEMTLFADVIDPYLAIKTIPEDLAKKGIKEDYYFTISKGDKIIADKVLPNLNIKH